MLFPYIFHAFLSSFNFSYKKCNILCLLIKIVLCERQQWSCSKCSFITFQASPFAMLKLDSQCSSLLLIEVTVTTHFLALMNWNLNDGCVLLLGGKAQLYNIFLAFGLGAPSTITSLLQVYKMDLHYMGHFLSNPFCCVPSQHDCFTVHR